VNRLVITVSPLSHGFQTNQTIQAGINKQHLHASTWAIQLLHSTAMIIIRISGAK
jgi:hypothetical protein